MKSLLVVELCDNDYGYSIKDALEHLYLDTENIYNHSTDAIKQYIIAHIDGRLGKNSALTNCKHNSERIKKYLSKMRVTFSRELPRNEPDGETVDHDGGSAAIDLALGYAFTF